MASQRPSPAERAAAEDTARRQLAVLRDLKSSPGFRHWLLPRLKSLRDGMEARVLAGQCEDHAAYKAEVKLIAELDNTIFHPLARDEERLAASIPKP